MSLKDDTLAKLKELGLSPKRSLGQNFLIREDAVEKIVQAVKSFRPKAVEEVGPGLGSLTHSLLKAGLSLRVVELDRGFAEYWRNLGLEVTEADALQINWAELNLVGNDVVLVSNLPYQISASLVIDRSLDATPCTGMILMFQKEVAQRITAKSGSEDYGMLSVVAQTFWHVEGILEAGPRDFWPAPKVASRVLRFSCALDRLNGASKQDFFRFVKQGFSQPRKLLASNLQLGPRSKEWTTHRLEAMGLDGKSRPGNLSPEHWLILFEADRLNREE